MGSHDGGVINRTPRVAMPTMTSPRTVDSALRKSAPADILEQIAFTTYKYNHRGMRCGHLRWRLPTGLPQLWPCTLSGPGYRAGMTAGLAVPANLGRNGREAPVSTPAESGEARRVGC